MILINGQPENRIDISDRGLQYGDGVFETIAYRSGQLEFLEAHFVRLRNGCQRLGIMFDNWQLLRDELAAVCSQQRQAVIKIMITRGSGGRGYKAADTISPTRIISAHPIPAYPEQNRYGVTVRLCQYRLGINSFLAGIKHLNRLEQVLARNEWQQTDIAEGLMLNINDELIEGTMSNLFIVSQGKLQTPSVLNCGIAGIIRGVVIQLASDLGIAVSTTTLRLEDLLMADEVFLTNSLMNIWPVVRLTSPETHWLHGPITQRLQKALQQQKR